MRLLLEHVSSAKVGWSVRFVDTDRGLVGVFRVDRGRRGDRALALAATSVKGLSPRVDSATVRTIPDPDLPGVTLVVWADLLEVSLTETPGFAGSHVLAVQA